MPRLSQFFCWSQFKARTGLWLLTAFGLIGLTVLFCFDPARFHIYPVCVLHQTTGLLCPGCGSLRALHQLLHGHPLAAFHLNPLLVCALPVLAALGAWHMLRKLKRLPAPPLPAPVWFGVFLVASIAFGIWRNLPANPQ